MVAELPLKVAEPFLKVAELPRRFRKLLLLQWCIRMNCKPSDSLVSSRMDSCCIPQHWPRNHISDLYPYIQQRHLRRAELRLEQCLVAELVNYQDQ